MYFFGKQQHPPHTLIIISIIFSIVYNPPKRGTDLTAFLALAVLTEFTDFVSTAVCTAILTPVMHAEPRSAAVGTAILTLVMVTNPTSITVPAVIPHCAMFTPLIERLQLILPPTLDIRHLNWASAIYSVPSNIIFFIKNRLF